MQRNKPKIQLDALDVADVEVAVDEDLGEDEGRAWLK